MPQTTGTLAALIERLTAVLAEAREGHGIDPGALTAEARRLHAMAEMIERNLAD